MSEVSEARDVYRGAGFLDRFVGWVLFLQGWRRFVLTFAAGAVCTFALPPYNFPAVGFVGFPLFVWLIDGATLRPARSAVARFRSAFFVGWVFGFGYFVAGLWWLGAAMLVNAAEFAVFIPFAVLVLPAICAIYFGLATGVARLFWSDSAYRILALAASLATFEYLRGYLFTGFPWNEIGVMAAPIPLMMQSASLVGVHGLTLMAIIVFAAPAAFADLRGRRVMLAVAATLLVAHLGYGAWRLSTHPSDFVDAVTLRVVQPNIEQSDKWDEAEAKRIFDRHLDLTTMRRGNASAAPNAGSNLATKESEAPKRTLVVWPETSFPFILTERPDAIAQIADALQPGETLIAGAARIEETSSETRYYNSVYVIDDNGEIVDARDKVHLVPFGEYLPFQSLLESIGLKQIAGNLPGGFSAGAERTRVPLEGAPSFLPLICYEIIFPGEIDVGTSATRPGFLVNDTNDAWYGDTPGPFQHLRLAELTSVSFGLPLVRSANTGISVVMDAYGRQIGGLALGAAGTIDVGLPQAAPTTPFARYGSVIFWLAVLAAWVVVIATRSKMRVRID